MEAGRVSHAGQEKERNKIIAPNGEWVKGEYVPCLNPQGAWNA